MYIASRKKVKVAIEEINLHSLNRIGYTIYSNVKG
jgi:hypothetical protein